MNRNNSFQDERAWSECDLLFVNASCWVVLFLSYLLYWWENKLLGIWLFATRPEGHDISLVLAHANIVEGGFLMC